VVTAGSIRLELIALLVHHLLETRALGAPSLRSVSVREPSKSSLRLRVPRPLDPTRRLADTRIGDVASPALDPQLSLQRHSAILGLRGPDSFDLDRSDSTHTSHGENGAFLSRCPRRANGGQVAVEECWMLPDPAIARGPGRALENEQGRSWTGLSLNGNRTESRPARTENRRARPPNRERPAARGWWTSGLAATPISVSTPFSNSSG